MSIDLRHFNISNLQGSIYRGTFDDYDDLVVNFPVANFGDMATVENPQGASWKTFWIGGTYFPEGTYYWTGSEWSSNVKLISDELQALNDGKRSKDPSVIDVYTALDLPTPSGGEYPLVANTTYKFYGTVGIGGSLLKLGSNTVLEGFDQENSKIVYTGTFSAIIGLNVGGRIQDLTIEAPNTSTFCIGLEDTISVASNYVIKDCVFDGCLVGISTKNLKRISVDGCSFVDMGSTGILVQGILNEDIIVKDNLFKDCVDASIDLTFASAVSNRYMIRDNEFVSPTGSVAIDGDASNANINEFMRILDCVFSGDGNSLGGITSEDSRVWVQTSLGEDISPSTIIGSYSFSGNALTTPVTDGVFTNVVGVGTASPLNERFTVSDTSNVTKLTANNLIDKKGTAVVTFSATQAGGGTRNYAMTFNVNGVDLPEEYDLSLTADSDLTTFTLPVEILDTYDFIPRIMGVGTGNDVVFSSLNVLIR